MMFITGKVIPVPIDESVATTRTSLSSHAENEKIRYPKSIYAADVRRNGTLR
jgi:hypothetical protein